MIENGEYIKLVNDDKNDLLLDNIRSHTYELKNVFYKIEHMLNKKNIVTKKGIKISANDVISDLIMEINEYKEKGLVGGYMGLESNISSLQRWNQGQGIIKLTEFMLRKGL